MNRGRGVPIGLVVALVAAILLVGGCAAEETSDPVVPPEETTTPEPVDEDENGGLELAIVNEWLESGHANIQDAAAEREECVRCHDGGAFAGDIADPAALDREFFVSIDCRACHTGAGVELAEGGLVDIPNQTGVRGGVGALCMSCHNARGVPDPAAERRSAPHYSAQAEIVTASGAMPIDGVEFETTERHVSVPDTCVGCHSETHAFAVSYSSCESAECHARSIDLETEALGDYDGDGTIASFQEEVQGLLDMLEAAIVESIDGGAFPVGRGAINFADQAGADISVPDEVYAAAYNHTLVANDGSLGVHNPAFVVSLLQESYTLVTGEDHPGEMLVEEE